MGATSFRALARTLPARVLPGLAALALAGGALAPTDVSGQAATVTFPDREPTGWIGISVEMQGAVERSGERSSVVRIVEVRPGSPAARAGLRAGDVLVALNGRTPEEGFVRLVGGLRPGDPVEAVVERDGTRRDFRFEAGSRPSPAGAPSTYRVLVRADTLAERMYRAMDSLRLRIAAGEGSRAVVRLGRRPTDSAAEATGFWHLDGPTEVRELVRAPELPGGWRAAEGGHPFRLLFVEGDTLPPPAPARVPGMAGGAADAAVTLRPLAPYALGANRVAGAEIVELKPELAEYFAVERGVLVVDVPAGTPAARAGLQPGDVLTAVGAVAVGSLAEVRRALAQPRDSLALRVVRKGAPLRVMLRR